MLQFYKCVSLEVSAALISATYIQIPILLPTQPDDSCQYHYQKANPVSCKDETQV